MELVYLWVEKYKNIDHQGFNFSPRFTCKYENNELTITKNEHHSIFPPNINVTAIVGENGSGKSSLLELLPYGPKKRINGNVIFLVFKHNDEYLLFKHSPTAVTIKTEKNVRTYDEFQKFSDEYQIRRLDYDMDFTKENFSDKDISSTLDNAISFGFSFKEQFLIQNNKRFDIEKYKHISNELIFILKDELIKFDSFFKPSYIKISCFNRSNKIHLEINEAIKKLKKLENKEDNLNTLIEELAESKNELMKFKYNQKIFMKDLDTLKIIFKTPLQNYFFIDFYNEQDVNFSEFSQGERSFYIHFLFLTDMYLNHQKSNENINTFFLLDEPDTTFHPNWQKKYIKELINIFKNYNNNIHFIITSHSPFLLSDLPKENVIFLEKGKQVYPNIETFGANIHTLLSHGFFMKDGLMGEFAKNKINEMIDYLNGKDSPIKDDDEAQKYIRIIGEPIVKRQLQRMLDSKKLDKMKEIDALKNQIESLQSRLENLEKKS